MYKLIFCLFILSVVHRSSQYSMADAKLKEFKLKEFKNENNELNSNLIDDQLELEEQLEKELEKEAEKEFASLFHREPDFAFNAQQMVEYRGFKFEAHHVITEDCYVLEMHRIVNPLDSTPNKPPILLQHGLIDSSTGFMINSIGGRVDDKDDRNLAFALAKRGYDVWLGNFRGNMYSKNHTTFSTKDAEFWKFTYDNHAFQDLPAEIGHIQKVTNYDEVAYLGYSQGSLTMFELLAFKPEVAKAIRPYIALAPVAFVGAVPTPLRYLAISERLVRMFLHRNIEFPNDSSFFKLYSKLACPLFPGLICKNSLYIACGFSARQLNSTRLPVFFNHLVPTSTSLPNIAHLGQGVRSKRMTLLDYMSVENNMECYNSVTPPRVPLENIVETDMYLFNALNDLMADPKDVDKLKAALKVKFHTKTVEIKKFSHIDFVLSVRADHYVNDYLFKVMKKKTPSKSVDPKKRLRLKTFDKRTCVVPKRGRRCHLDLQHALRNIV